MTQIAQMTLTEFLLARIAEDEEEPKMVRDGWRDLADMLPLGAWDSERVMAECEARRRIVEMMSASYSENDVEYWALDDALRLLALPYADHPDYREERRV